MLVSGRSQNDSERDALQQFHVGWRRPANVCVAMNAILRQWTRYKRRERRPPNVLAPRRHATIAIGSQPRDARGKLRLALVERVCVTLLFLEEVRRAVIDDVFLPAVD